MLLSSFQSQILQLTQVRSEPKLAAKLRLGCKYNLRTHSHQGEDQGPKDGDFASSVGQGGERGVVTARALQDRVVTRDPSLVITQSLLDRVVTRDTRLVTARALQDRLVTRGPRLVTAVVL